jgi:hypothetical protein
LLVIVDFLAHHHQVFFFFFAFHSNVFNHSLSKSTANSVVLCNHFLWLFPPLIQSRVHPLRGVFLSGKTGF